MGNPIKQFLHGFQSFLHGFKWFRNHPSYAMLVIIPFIISALSMALGLSWLITAMDSILTWFWIPAPENWWTTILHYTLSGILGLFGIYIAISLIPIFVNILSAPIYEVVSCAVENTVEQKAQEISLLQSLIVARDEIIKVFILFAINTLLFIVPGAGLLTPLVTAFILGWNAFDYPLARRGWSLKRRWHHARDHFIAVIGLGFWLMIPFLQILFMPLAIAGGTLLALDTLDTERNAL